MACAFPSVGITPQETGQYSGELSSERKQQKPALVPFLAAPAKVSKDFLPPCCNLQSSLPDVDIRVLSLLITAIVKTFEDCMQSTTTDIMKTRVRAVSSDNAKPTIVLDLPGVRLAVLISALDLDITLSSAALLLLATYVACVLAWNILSFVLALFAQATAFVLITSYTFTGFAMLSTEITSSTAITYHDISELEKKGLSTILTLPLLCIDSTISSFKFAHVSKSKTYETTVFKRKELQAPARRRVLAQLNRNRLLVNVVPGDMRRRADMNLGEANIRVGKAFVQAVLGMRKPRDIYVVRVDCGAQSTIQEKHMNPVIMWDVTATFDEFELLERDLKKEVRAKKQLRGAKVPHLSSGAVLFVQPKLTNHVLSARRARLQTFIDTVRSDPVFSTTRCLRKFLQAY